MPLVVNGVTIPTNVANALMVNGVSVTQVIANGVQVWLQNLVPVFSAGTSYVVLQAYTSTCNVNVWSNLITRTFTGGAGSVLSMRAMAYSAMAGEWTGYGLGRILKNGNQVVYLAANNAEGWNYSSFVDVALNPYDVVSIQCNSLNYDTDYEGGGGQIFAAQNATAYFV